ncbi:nucleotidyltransferase domain-containing protein [Candidatus Woesearchaeota archaeon]|nr:nucleotidyltransferase domain-containing protein [Candidatus Woesearchaeota archaeon]
MTAQAVAYVQNYLSFLFLNYSLSKSINNVYLYGSAVRSELTNKSDIDLFIDCSAETEKEIENAAKAAFSRFYVSKDYDKWKRFKFTYPLSIHAGTLASWQLKTSIASEGILLYSKSTNITSLLRMVLFTITLPSDKQKYLRFIRRMYGRKEKGYKEHGLLKEVEGKKLSSNVTIVPKENQHKVEAYLLKEKIDYSFKEISMGE